MTVENRKRPLRVLHVDPEKQWGGGESQVAGLIQYLSRQGHENHLLGHLSGPLTQWAREEGVPTFPLTMRNEIDPRGVFSIRRLIRCEQYDIIHFHTKRAHALALWTGRLRFSSRRVVTRRMDYPIKKNWYNHSLYNRMVDGVVAISERIAQILLEGGVEETKIRVIHSGIDPAPFRAVPARSRNASPLVIGSAAVLEERKGHRFLLEALALLRRQGCPAKLILAGEGSEKGSLHKLAQKLGVQDATVFLGFQSDMPRFFSQVDLFVYPSLYEGLGVAVLEAMASGRPVIASKVGGLPELVEDRETGILVPPADSGALAEALGRLAAKKVLLHEMGEKGRRRVEKRFTVEKMAQRNEEFYYELLGGQLSAGPVRNNGA